MTTGGALCIKVPLFLHYIFTISKASIGKVFILFVILGIFRLVKHQ